MTKKEIQSRSQEKINQILSLMKTLRVEMVIKKRVTNEGFIEDVIFWTDKEDYKVDEEAPVTPNVTDNKQDEVKTDEVIEEVNETQDEKVS